jgi:hypothetical protein
MFYVHYACVPTYATALDANGNVVLDANGNATQAAVPASTVTTAKGAVFPNESRATYDDLDAAYAQAGYDVALGGASVVRILDDLDAEYLDQKRLAALVAKIRVAITADGVDAALVATEQSAG